MACFSLTIKKTMEGIFVQLVFAWAKNKQGKNFGKSKIKRGKFLVLFQKVSERFDFLKPYLSIEIFSQFAILDI